MSKQLDLAFYPSSTSSVEDSRVKTSAAPASERALVVLAAACGLNTYGSWASFDRLGLWSRTSPAARICGLTTSSKTWRSKAMRAYRSRLRRLMSVHRKRERESLSLLPTLTRKANLLAPSMQKWAGHRRLVQAEVIGGPLNPTWCEWFQGFPEGWTTLKQESQRLETLSCLNAPRSSGM